MNTHCLLFLFTALRWKPIIWKVLSSGKLSFSSMPVAVTSYKCLNKSICTDCRMMHMYEIFGASIQGDWIWNLQCPVHFMFVFLPIFIFSFESTILPVGTFLLLFELFNTLFYLTASTLSYIARQWEWDPVMSLWQICSHTTASRDQWAIDEWITNSLLGLKILVNWSAVTAWHLHSRLGQCLEIIMKRILKGWEHFIVAREAQRRLCEF